VTYRIELTPSARRDLHRLSAKAAFAVLEYLEGPLAENPYRVGTMLREDPTEQYTARIGRRADVYHL
jgi:mRNA-degrading endonuclease RelE of RelBE toxin-antitoxin system